MAEPFIAEIRIFAGDFAPRSWAFCNGQLLQISQNTALFSLIGTTYGGDGRTSMALPDMRSRVPMHPGRGPGLASRRLGERGGSETQTLNQTHMPDHTHTMRGNNDLGEDSDPNNKVLGRASGATPYQTAASSLVNLANETLSPAGSTSPQSHENVQPVLTLNFIIALQGLYPSRS